MKHKAILYTCVGLMGTAAVTGFVDYTHASKAGLFEGLYAEETPVVNAVLTSKELEMKDYSRAAFEYQAAEETRDNTSNTARRDHRKNDVPPPPVPAPPALVEDIAPQPPPVAPSAVVAPDAPPPPVAPVAETDNVTTPADAPPPPDVKEVKEISTKSFSRAPFPKKKVNRSSKYQ